MFLRVCNALHWCFHSSPQLDSRISSELDASTVGSPRAHIETTARISTNTKPPTAPYEDHIRCVRRKAGTLDTLALQSGVNLHKSRAKSRSTKTARARASLPLARGAGGPKWLRRDNGPRARAAALLWRSLALRAVLRSTNNHEMILPKPHHAHGQVRRADIKHVPEHDPGGCTALFP